MTTKNPRIYLDNAATTALLPGVQSRISEVMASFGNPSSLHAHGREAKHEIDWAREKVSQALGCLFAEVVFTGSGTEAANLAIVGAVLANPNPQRNRIILSAVEHHCVLHTQPLLERLGYQVELIPVDRESKVRLDAIEELVTDDVLLVSLMSANNETGMIQPVEAAAKIAHTKGALLHCDHVQGFLKDVSNPCQFADLVSVAAHKVNGPKGVGALAVLNGTKIKPLVTGGEQEREMRGGTENLLGIVGFGAAIAGHQTRSYKPMRDSLRTRLLATGAVPTVANPDETLDTHLHVRFPGIDAETLLIRLDREGISASSGAACSSGSIEPSHVMLACGYTETEAKEGVRFSLGYGNTAEEIERASTLIAEAVQSIREKRNG
ncbi:MAG: cysteine desulfurase [Armatimonadetes bacterium]|nr:cysteine desulfurase [Armatimonadota bacterium]